MSMLQTSPQLFPPSCFITSRHWDEIEETEWAQKIIEGRSSSSVHVTDNGAGLGQRAGAARAQKNEARRACVGSRGPSSDGRRGLSLGCFSIHTSSRLCPTSHLTTCSSGRSAAHCYRLSST